WRGARQQQRTNHQQLRREQHQAVLAAPDNNTIDQQLREQHLHLPLSFSAKNQSKY
ncbi:hypothetical protein MTR67_033941, partial [Solanum verrucosum]